MALPFLLFGLGNPGPRYERTRHNVGFDAVDAIAEVTGCPLKKRMFRPLLLGTVDPFNPPFCSALVLTKPLTYMNRSGDVLPWLVRKYRLDPSRICVVVDNMDLDPGEIRMKQRGGKTRHNGLRSVSAVLETGEYPRIYVGIGRPSGSGDVVDHVLGRFSTDDSVTVIHAIRRLADLFREPSFRSVDQLVTAVNARRKTTPRRRTDRES